MCKCCVQHPYPKTAQVLDAFSRSFLSKALDSGSNTLFRLFLAMNALFCFFLSKASDSKPLCLALDSLSYSLLMLFVPVSNSLLRFIAILSLSLIAMDLCYKVHHYKCKMHNCKSIRCGHSLAKSANLLLRVQNHVKTATYQTTDKSSGHHPQNLICLPQLV